MAIATPTKHISILRTLIHNHSSLISILRSSTRTTRIMSTAVLAKHDWIVILPDHDGKLPDRMAARESHLKAIMPVAESGFWKMGGAMLEEVPTEGTGLKIFGSVMVAHAASKEEILEMLKNDIYFKTNVWNMDKIQIHPFKTAFRNP